MPDIPPEMLNRLRAILKRCGPFSTDYELKATFADVRISQWRDKIALTGSMEGNIKVLIDFLRDQYNSKQENALILFLSTLRDEANPANACHGDLAQLITDLQHILERPTSSLQPSHPEHSYTFINREEDQMRIFKQLNASPYLHLYAPSGIGKTYLAKQLLQEKYRGHPSAYFDFRKSKFGFHGRSMYKLLYELRKQFYKSSAVLNPTRKELILDIADKTRKTGLYGVVVLDNVELMATKTIKEFREDVLPTLEKQIDDPTLYLRVITIAQTEMEELSGIKTVSFYPYPLAAFHGASQEPFAYRGLLRQAVKCYTGKELPTEEASIDRRLKRWSNELYALTGGHPGAIVETLNYIGKQTGFSSADIFVEHRESICRHVLGPLLSMQVRKCFPEKINFHNFFRELWVFRYLSKGILLRWLHTVKDKASGQTFIDFVSDTDGNMEKLLWKYLTDTPLLQFTGVRRLLPHQLTPIWRKMGNLILRATDPNLYAELHCDARRIFDYFTFREEGDVGMRVDCFVEGLYHLTQKTTSPASRRARSEFSQYVMTSLDSFLSPLKNELYFQEHLYNLKTLIANDLELQTELDYAGESYTSQQLLHSITQYMNKDQGELK